MTKAAHTAGPWHVGVQNDAVFVIAGKPPALNNDYPEHNANRTVIAKPLNEADAPLISTAPDGLKLAQSISDYFGQRPSEQMNVDRDLYDQAQAIIAKAEAR